MGNLFLTFVERSFRGLLVSYVCGEVISWVTCFLCSWRGYSVDYLFLTFVGKVISWVTCFLRSWIGNFVGYLFLTFVER